MDSTGGDSVDTHLVINHGIVSAAEPGQQGLTGAPLVPALQGGGVCCISGYAFSG